MNARGEIVVAGISHYIYPQISLVYRISYIRGLKMVKVDNTHLKERSVHWCDRQQVMHRVWLELGLLGLPT